MDKERFTYDWVIEYLDSDGIVCDEYSAAELNELIMYAPPVKRPSVEARVLLVSMNNHGTVLRWTGTSGGRLEPESDESPPRQRHINEWRKNFAGAVANGLVYPASGDL